MNVSHAEWGGAIAADVDATGLANLLATAAAARVRLWPENGSVHYRSPSPLTPELRAAILAHKPVLLELLAKWDGTEASRLCADADGLVCDLGVSGADEEIQKAAALAAWGLYCEVMAGVRMGCALVEERARKLAAAKGETRAA